MGPERSPKGVGGVIRKEKMAGEPHSGVPTHTGRGDAIKEEPPERWPM